MVDQFPTLFDECAFKYDDVIQMGSWNGGVWCWKFLRCEEVLGREASCEFHDLSALLQWISPVINTNDVILWPFDKSKAFTVRSCYELWNHLQGSTVMNDARKLGLSVIRGHKFRRN